MARRASPEFDLQKAVVEHLMLRRARGCCWFAVPNGEKRSPITGAKLKAMGVRPGVSDLIILVNRRPYALELKAGRGAPSLAQDLWGDEWVSAGGSYHVGRDLDDVLSYLARIGAIV